MDKSRTTNASSARRETIKHPPAWQTDRPPDAVAVLCGIPPCCCCCCLKDVVAMATVRGQCQRLNIDETIKQPATVATCVCPSRVGWTLPGQITSSTWSFPLLSFCSPSSVATYCLPVSLARPSCTNSVIRSRSLATILRYMHRSQVVQVPMQSSSSSSSRPGS